MSRKGMKTLFSFYSKKDDIGASSETPSSEPLSNDISQSTSIEQVQRPPKLQKVNDTISHDPGLRQAIWKHPYKEQNEIRRRYIAMGPCQPSLQEYPRNEEGRSFRYDWFKTYDWLEYSETTDRAYCFPCFLFDSNSSQHHKQEAWVSKGFNSWKRAGGKESHLRVHEGATGSIHSNNVLMLDALKKPSQNIQKHLTLQGEAEIKKNRLRVITTVNAIRWLACQGCALRGHDESLDSKNCGNFIELLKYSATLNSQVEEVILEKAPGNASYTSPLIQKEIMEIMGDMVRKTICEEIGDYKYCILVDESRDESNCEQMAIVLRFVDADGFIKERFFDVVGVEDTTALTLKKTCSLILDRNGLLVQNIRGQGYDGASNMRGAWNGLQSLFLKECPYAYYVHCFAHRLQLALVAASSELADIELFFQMLNCIVNLVGASPKRNQQLKAAQREQIENLIEKDELQTSKGGNQQTTLRRPASTRWSSHYSSACSLLGLYGPARTVLGIIKADGLNRKIRAEATGGFNAMSTFDFIFNLHLMVEIMGVTEVLCQSLQRKDQDILTGLDCISITKSLLCELKNDYKWQNFLQSVVSFCRKHGIDVPDMNARYLKGTGRSCQQSDEISIEHHYRFDVLYEVVNTQVMELSERFSDKAVELLSLSSALDPKDCFKSFKVDDLCLLAEKYYPGDFSEMEINYQLKHQLQHYGHDMRCDSQFQNITTLSELCQKLVSMGKSKRYPLVDQLIRLVLTLPVSTASTERAFSAMKLIKTSLRNKMGDELLSNNMILYIEREITSSLDTEDIVNEFDSRYTRRVRLR